jgi:hypothetical protein
MSEFTHEVSEDGLTLTTSVAAGDITGSVSVTWETAEVAAAHIDTTKLANEARLSEMVNIGRSTSAGISRKRLGPFSVGYGSTRGDYDNWLLRIGSLAIRPSGISREADGNRFALGFGTRRKARFLTVEKHTDPAAPAPEAETKRVISREDVAVPLKNPFRHGDTVIVPAGALVWEKDMREGKTIDRKRTVKPWHLGDGYFSMEKLSPGHYGSGLVGTILAHKPYIVWGEKELRTEVTPELLEANGKSVEYVEGEYENFSAYIESGNYELKDMGL